MSLWYFFVEQPSYLVGMGLWILALVVGLWCLIRWRQRWKNQPKRLVGIHIVLSVWMLLATLTAVELAFALFYDTTDSFNRTNVSKKWYRIHADPYKRPLEVEPGTGFYYRDDHDFAKSLNDGRHRVCFFGDSFTFGHGINKVADRFSNRLAAILEAERPGQYEVTNFADAGTDLHWMEVQLQGLLENGFQIDTAIYVMCLNDIETFHERHRTYYVDFDKRVGEPHCFLFRNTYFFNLMFYRVRYLLAPELRDYYTFVREYYESEPWQRMQEKLSDVQKLCQSHGTDFRVIIFPFLHNLGPDYPFHHAHQEAAEYCHQVGIPVLDLEPVLTNHVSEGLTLNRFDAHPNKRTHKLTAQAIWESFFRDLTPSSHRSTEKPSSTDDDTDNG